jgi:hypothetical protein
MICGAAHNESLAEMAAHLKHPTTDPFRLHGLSRMAGETGVWARAGDWCERVSFPFGSPYPHPGLRSVSPRGRDTFAIQTIADGDHCVLYTLFCPTARSVITGHFGFFLYLPVVPVAGVYGL